MMTPAVVSLPHGHHGLAAQLLPDVAHETITGVDRIYFLYQTTQRGSDATFVDPLDGELLIELIYFSSESDARTWVAADIAMRDGRTEGVQ